MAPDEHKAFMQRLLVTGGDAWDKFLMACYWNAHPAAPAPHNPQYGSPIESMFAVAMRACVQGPDRTIGFWPKWGLTVEEAAAICTEHRARFDYGGVFPQVRVHKYTVDFMALYPKRGGGYCGIVAECDGHDFHERTKAQAASDKSRDRYLQTEGYKVYRFTGSEIWRDAFACANEVLWAAYNEAMDNDEFLDQFREGSTQ